MSCGYITFFSFDGRLIGSSQVSTLTANACTLSRTLSDRSSQSNEYSYTFVLLNEFLITGVSLVFWYP